MPNRTQFASGPDGHVAYRTAGDGPVDIVFVPDWATNVDVMWDDPAMAKFLDRLAGLGRLICFDKRGTGVSDPVPLGAIPTLEQWQDDIRSVLDAAGSERAVVYGHGDGGTMAILFAATYPDRTVSLVLQDAYARRARADDYPMGVPDHFRSRLLGGVIGAWGQGTSVVGGAPALAGDPAAVERRAKFERLAMSPAEFRAMYPLTMERDLRAVLPTIRVPALVMHRAHNSYVLVENGRYLADHIEGARYVELPGADHFFHSGATEQALDALREFLTGAAPGADDDRVLATVLFTDIVDATERAATTGDAGWRDLLHRHHALVRGELARHRGHEVDTAGDGFFATFDGPARAVRCALAIQRAVGELGLQVRCGLHTGECQIIDGKAGGMAVHIGARVAGLAGPGEVLVSRTVKDLVVGSGLGFEPRGEHELKGIEGRWELFACRGIG